MKMNERAELEVVLEKSERAVKKAQERMKRLEILMPLAPFIQHDPGCNISLPFFWSRKRPCDCGCEKAWMEALGHENWNPAAEREGT